MNARVSSGGTLLILCLGFFRNISEIFDGSSVEFCSYIIFPFKFINIPFSYSHIPFCVLRNPTEGDV